MRGRTIPTSILVFLQFFHSLNQPLVEIHLCGPLIGLYPVYLVSQLREIFLFGHQGKDDADVFREGNQRYAVLSF
jgi:hypothetical protein